jgi:hypothetical protein
MFFDCHRIFEGVSEIQKKVVKKSCNPVKLIKIRTARTELHFGNRRGGKTQQTTDGFYGNKGLDTFIDIFFE